MLMGMRLRTTGNAHARLAYAFAAEDEGGAAIGNRATIQQFQRQRHRLRRHHICDGDLVVKLRTGMDDGVFAHQHREFREVFLR